MNYQTYMKQVEERIEDAPKETLINYLKSIARKVPMNDREVFLQHFSDPSLTHSDEKIERGYVLIRKINQGHSHLLKRSYGDYDYQWDETIIFKDPYSICKDLSFLCYLTLDLINTKSYKKANDLFEQILTLKIKVLDDYGDDSEDMFLYSESYEWLTFYEIIEEGLINLTIDELMTSYYYSICQLKNHKEAPPYIWNLINKYGSRTFNFESILATGQAPLKNLASLIDSFVHYLHDKSGMDAEYLLKQLIPLYQGDQLLYARKVANTHPYIYLDLLNKMEGCDMLSVGQDALKYLPKTFTIKSEIASIMAQYHKKRNNLKQYKTLLKIIYQSESSPLNLMQLYTVCTVEEVMIINGENKEVPIKNHFYSYSSRETKRNSRSQIDQNIVEMLTGHIERIMAQCDLDTEYLGWSNNTIGAMVPLLLLLLSPSQGNYTHAESAILAKLLPRLGYNNERTRVASYDDILTACKEKLTFENNNTQYLEWIKRHLENRLTAVVGGGYRKSYHKVAELVVAYAHVYIHYNENACIEEIIDYFRAMYPRKSAFKKELLKIK